MSKLDEVLSATEKPALLIGNGINRYRGQPDSSWDDLLGKLATARGLDLGDSSLSEMSNTEFFDILDLKSPQNDRSNLQKEFCTQMEKWTPGAHHKDIVRWAERNQRPIITVNFDENLSRSVNAEYMLGKEGFTDFYPWSSYFSNRRIHDVRSSFAIWHAHGMQRYHRSIRLGLTHYMGSVHRARTRVYGKNGLRLSTKAAPSDWRSSNTWLEAFFFSPIIIIGFGFGKDETFFRWLFLERARLHKLRPEWKCDTWFVDIERDKKLQQSAFLAGLGIQQIILSDYDSLYTASCWLE